MLQNDDIADRVGTHRLYTDNERLNSVMNLTSSYLKSQFFGHQQIPQQTISAKTSSPAATPSAASMPKNGTTNMATSGRLHSFVFHLLSF